MKGPWDREIYSRNKMLDLKIFNDNDLLIMSDSDEIPNPLILKEAANWISSETHYTLEQSCYAYWINNLYSSKWYGSRIATFNYMKNKKADDIREATEAEFELSGSIINNGGWHFTYLGDEKHIRQKISSFCDRQFDIPEIKDNIAENLSKGKDVLNRSFINYERVDIDDSFPEFLINNQEKYAHLIKSEDKNKDKNKNKNVKIRLKKNNIQNKFYIKNE